MIEKYFCGCSGSERGEFRIRESLKPHCQTEVFEVTALEERRGLAGNYPDRSISAAGRRIEEALELCVDTIVTSWPMCERMLIKASNGEVEVVNIVELLSEKTRPWCGLIRSMVRPVFKE